MGREDQFPYWMEDITNLPGNFQQALAPLLKSDGAIKSILMLPPQPFLKKGGVPKQVLLSTERGILHVCDGDPPTAGYLPRDALLYVQRTLVLLYGCLELTGEVNSRLVRIKAEYNTVGQELLDTALGQFLGWTHTGNHTNASSKQQHEALLQELGTKSLKFMNGLQFYALQPDEQLLGYVFQPRIREPVLHYFYHAIAPAALLALTDQTVILIKEDRMRGASYGWLLTLCPRANINDITIAPRGERSEVCVQLAGDNVTTDQSVILESDTASDWQKVWQMEHAR